MENDLFFKILFIFKDYLIFPHLQENVEDIDWKKIADQLKVADETLMQMLEKLDGLVLSAEATDSRNQRKELVTKIQVDT